MDFSYLYCPLHGQEVITNYCLQEQCRTGLCATCVCSHTSMHLQAGTVPVYENIRNTFQRLMEGIQTRTVEFQHVFYRVEQVEAKVEEKKHKVREIIHVARQQTLGLVTQFFESRQKELIAQMECSDKNSGLHCRARLKKLKQMISEEVVSLKSAAISLNSFNFLQMLPRIQMQQLYSSHEILSRIAAETKENQMYTTSISYDRQSLNLLKNDLNRLITVWMGVGLPTMECPQKMPRLPKPTVTKTPIQEQLKLFTLRRPDSQASISTVQFQHNKIDDKNKRQYNNVFQDCIYDENHPNESRLTLVKRGGEILADSDHEDSCGSTSGFKQQQPLQPEKLNLENKDLVLSSLLDHNYNFTFGSQVQPYNPFSRPKKQDSGSISRVSEKWKAKCDGLLGPASISDLQSQRFSSNIKKMQEKSKNNIKNSFVTSFDQDAQNKSENQSRFMYRTQLL